MDWVKCSWCDRDFLKDRKHINENKKFGHKFYCSLSCHSCAKNKRIELQCENSPCQNKFVRMQKAISRHNFCSRSCAAIFNNTQKWGVKVKVNVVYSDEDRKAPRPAAGSLGGTNSWLKRRSIYDKESIIKIIQDFVYKNSRIPIKREMWGMYKMARRHFGTWNNAIEAAGFEPNPVMFAKHQIAEDGHICDSLAEKMIDDYLCKKGVVHDRNIPYPVGTYTADFKVGDMIIEYFGLAGEHIRYDELRGIKKQIAKKYQMKLVEIYPNDLYSKDGLMRLLNQ